ncbi:MAG: glutathione S-transferase family protein [Rhodospirillales bacterium]
MMTLLGRKNSINVQKAAWCLNELGMDYERIDVGGPFKFDNDPGYLDKNPNGLVPTLIDGDFVLWESHAIVRYLCEKSGDPKWYPADIKKRAVISQWMDWVPYSLRKAHFAVFFAMVRQAPEKRDAEAIEEGRREWAKYFAMADAELGKHDYIAGDEISMADLVLGPFVYRWYALDIEHPVQKNMEAYYKRLAARPAFKEHVMMPLS